MKFKTVAEVTAAQYDKALDALVSRTNEYNSGWANISCWADRVNDLFETPEAFIELLERKMNSLPKDSDSPYNEGAIDALDALIDKVERLK